jgi:hypothetical protein
MSLVLSTHNRLMWSNGTVIHEGHGIYYGCIRQVPEGLGSLAWTAQRSPKGDALLQIDLGTGALLKKVSVPSVFVHDIFRNRDQVLVTDCDGGRVLVLQWPDMSFIRAIQVGTRASHLNTVCVLPNGELWCLFHQKGPSSLVRVDWNTGAWLEVLSAGSQSHGVVPWNGGFLILSSGTGELLHVTQTGLTVLWTDPDRKFLKGILLSGPDQVTFGVSDVTARSDRGSPALNCELVVFDLGRGTLVSRVRLPTRGLLNTIG